MSQPQSVSEPNEISIREAQELAQRAKKAQADLAELSQQQIDKIVDAMAVSACAEAETLARLAVDETGYGVAADKLQKNLFAAKNVHEFIRPMKTVGVIRRFDDRKVIEIAEPFGVVAAVVPSTNPTSTAIYKLLIAMKARCAIVLSPHPAAVRCITRTAEIMESAARSAGAPEGAINWMTAVSLEGTQALMQHRDVSVILATGGMGLVRAAYSAGKPAYGVGPGNAPAYIESSADIQKAVRDIVTGKTFDNGLLCSSENSVVVDESIAGEVRREFQSQGGYFLSESERDALTEVLITPQQLPNPSLVGKSALEISERAGISPPSGTRVLMVELDGVGRDYPLSIEKLCPVLSFYIVPDWHTGCERCMQILKYGGMGHTMAIHSRNDAIILEFGLKKPAFRIVVNTPTTHGSIGLTTGLDPSFTLGCGGYGGNITSDNISPMHLLNIKRLAHEISPAASSAVSIKTARPIFPEPPTRSSLQAFNGETLAKRIDAFLLTRKTADSSNKTELSSTSERSLSDKSTERTDSPVDFVCEDDVRQALRTSESILIDDQTILTPLARDLGEKHRVFVHFEP